MDRKKLRTNIGKVIRLFPIPKKFNGEYVSKAWNQWMMVEEIAKGFSLSNVVTNHGFTLPFDSIKEYREPLTILTRAQFFLNDNGYVDIVPYADIPMDDLSQLSGTIFQGTLSIGLSAGDYSKGIELPVISLADLPSFQAKNTIEEALLRKRRLADAGIPDTIAHTFRAMYPTIISRPYEGMTIEELETRLSTLKTTYEGADLYESFGVKAHQVNVHLLNRGNCYIEDASIELKFDNCLGLTIADFVPDRPSDGPFTINSTIHDEYPEVTQTIHGYRVSAEIGAIKHGRPMTAFEDSLRVVVTEEAKSQIIRIQCSIHGRNLSTARTEQLTIVVV